MSEEITGIDFRFCGRCDGFFPIIDAIFSQATIEFCSNCTTEALRQEIVDTIGEMLSETE